MPGAYAHLTLVNQASEVDRLEAAGLPDNAIMAVLEYKKYADLGAISPDLPYLKVFGSAKSWADQMHYQFPGEVIKQAARNVRREKDVETRKKKLAWLFGYASHVGGDTTIHPIVELKVGPYADNKGPHRICEMHQDAYIFQRLNLGDVGLSEFLDSGVGACTQSDESLDDDIVSIWTATLKECYPKEFSKNPPLIKEWFEGFVSKVDMLEEGYKLIPIARHVAVDEGLTYPAHDGIDNQYIENLKTPKNIPMHYDDIFDLALKNVVNLWQIVADYTVNENDTALENILNLNLDTGRDSAGIIKMWENV